jgi:hypothetical protein
MKKKGKPVETWERERDYIGVFEMARAFDYVSSALWRVVASGCKWRASFRLSSSCAWRVNQWSGSYHFNSEVSAVEAKTCHSMAVMMAQEA